MLKNRCKLMELIRQDGSRHKLHSILTKSRSCKFKKKRLKHIITELLTIPSRSEMYDRCDEMSVEDINILYRYMVEPSDHNKVWGV